MKKKIKMLHYESLNLFRSKKVILYKRIGAIKVLSKLRNY